MSMKLKIIGMFLLSVGSFDMSAQTAKTLLNRALNADLCLEVNDGGIPTEGLCVDGPTGNVSVANDLTVSGAFTSLGVDDNATSLAITIDATEHVGIGSAGTTSATFTVRGISGASSDVVRVLDSSGFQLININDDTGAGAPTLGVNSQSDNTKSTLNLNHDNTSAPTTIMAINSADTSGVNPYIQFKEATVVRGSITVDTTANTTAYNTTSDGRLKHNLQDFDGIAMVLQMNPVAYEWIENPGTKYYGFIAQELVGVFPQAVLVGGDDVDQKPWQVDYSKLTGVLTKALKEVIAESKNLRAMIDILSAKIKIIEEN